MESSRIFVRGLPPTMSEQDFKKHFGAKSTITDARLFQHRRIGYVGYQTPEDAVKAVKYFNKTFIRMSKIGVELARPIEDSTPTARREAAGQTIHVPTPTAQMSQSLKRKRGSPEPTTKDPKLHEFLHAMQRPSATKGLGKEELVPLDIKDEANPAAVADAEGESDDEYQTVAKKPKVPKERTSSPTDIQTPQVTHADQVLEGGHAPPISDALDEGIGHLAQDTAASDADWLRSRTSRLLGLTEDDEENTQVHRQNEDDEDVSDFGKGATATSALNKQTPFSTTQKDVATVLTRDGDDRVEESEEHGNNVGASGPEVIDDAEQKIRASSRLYLRNMAYNITESDLRSHFAGYGELAEAHVSIDNKTGTPKGFAFLQYESPDAAVEAWRDMDGKVFQGRLLHILPGAKERETQLDDYTLSKLPLKKQQQIKRKREATSSTFNWNALFMNADAVMSSVADRLGVAKSELLDPTSSDAAVKQAHAETHVIQETKAYFKNNGVDLGAFKRRERGDTAILIKNFPYDAKASELRSLLEEHGRLKRFLIPPTGTIAIAEFEQAPQARAAFSALAYKKIRSSVLFLEKAPKDLFDGATSTGSGDSESVSHIGNKPTSADVMSRDDSEAQPAASATLFVRNLNFTTTTERLTETFEPLAGFMSARVKTKTDPKKPGQVLSMGYGFVEFRTKEQGQAALTAMHGFTLDQHKLEIRASHKATDAAEERRKYDKMKKLAGRRTKVIIKNLPFEVSKKDIRALFGSYGQLRSVRLPKKVDRGTRGFAFADFTTPKEAENAMDALRDTHLLGRRLVLDFAAEDPEDAEAEIEKMQNKVGSQINKVALQKLTGGGRKKFNVGDQEEDA